MQNPQEVLDSIVHILKTRRYDRENDLETSYRVHGKWVNPDQAINIILSLARKSSPETRVYQVIYRINNGFQYSVNCDAINKREAKTYVIRENSDEGKVTIQGVNRVKES